MVTSIQVHERLKLQLDNLKEEKESYEGVISRLIAQTEKQKRAQTSLLVEGYKEMAQESMRITKEWSPIDKDWD